MLRSAVAAVLAVALSPSVAAAQTFTAEAGTLFALAASLTPQAPIEKSDLAVASFLVELTPPVVMDTADLEEGSVFRSALAAVRAMARSSSAMLAQVRGAESAREAASDQSEVAIYHVEIRAPRRPASLVPLYAVHGAMQALDLFSTWRVLDSGRGREANPLLKSGSRPLMLGAKIAATSVQVVGTEKLWKRHPRLAVGLTIATNIFMSGVVTHNLRLGS